MLADSAEAANGGAKLDSALCIMGVELLLLLLFQTLYPQTLSTILSVALITSSNNLLEQPVWWPKVEYSHVFQ